MTQHDDDKCDFEADIHWGDGERICAIYAWGLAAIVVLVLLATGYRLLRYLVGG